MATEPRKRGWTVAARTASDGIKVGHISEAILPNTFKILVADRYECRVIENPLNGSWTIRSGRSHVARITDIAQFATGQPPNAPKRPSAELVSPFTSTVRVHQPQGVPAGTITTDATIDPQAPLALAILLTLEMIRAEASIPTIRVDDGSGYSI